jgi:hypothetical protein
MSLYFSISASTPPAESGVSGQSEAEPEPGGSVTGYWFALPAVMLASGMASGSCVAEAIPLSSLGPISALPTAPYLLAVFVGDRPTNLMVVNAASAPPQPSESLDPQAALHLACDLPSSPHPTPRDLGRLPQEDLPPARALADSVDSQFSNSQFSNSQFSSPQSGNPQSSNHLLGSYPSGPQPSPLEWSCL